jgi:hypothetical protein
MAMLIDFVETTERSGVTTMGSDRANPGAPNQNGPNGGPQAQAVAKTLARASDMSQCRFLTIRNL